MTFSNFDEPSSPQFKSLNIIKWSDLVTFDLAVLMFKYHNRLLPAVFNYFFAPVNTLHNCNTRQPLNSLIIYPKLKQIMNYLILDFKDLAYGSTAKKKLNPSLSSCLKRGSKILFYVNISSSFVFKKKGSKHFFM